MAQKLIPEAKEGLSRFKEEVAHELGKSDRSHVVL